jgi:hypothetical protein
MACRYRIQLLRTPGLEPVHEQWLPSVELWEVAEANERLHQAALPLCWKVVQKVQDELAAPMVAASYGA